MEASDEYSSPTVRYGSGKGYKHRIMELHSLIGDTIGLVSALGERARGIDAGDGVTEEAVNGLVSAYGGVEEIGEAAVELCHIEETVRAVEDDPSERFLTILRDTWVCLSKAETIIEHHVRQLRSAAEEGDLPETGSFRRIRLLKLLQTAHNNLSDLSQPDIVSGQECVSVGN